MNEDEGPGREQRPCWDPEADAWDAVCLMEIMDEEEDSWERTRWEDWLEEDT